MTGHLFPAVAALPFGAHPGTLPIRPPLSGKLAIDDARQWNYTTILGNPLTKGYGA